MTSCIGAVGFEELLSIFMAVQEEGLDCSEEECSKLFGNVAYIQLYIASYSRSMNVQVFCEGHCKLVNNFGRFEGTAILRNVATQCNITEDPNFRNLNNTCICKFMRFFRHVKMFENLSLGWQFCETRSVNLTQQKRRTSKTS